MRTQVEKISRHPSTSILLGFFILAFFFALQSVAQAATTATLYPTSDGTYTAWTPKAGAVHYTQVDETTCNGTTDYVSETTAGDRDSYGVSLSSVPNGATITQISLTPCASRNSAGGGSATLNVFYRYSGVNSSDAGAYAITGTTPTGLAATNFSSLSHVKGGSSTLEVGAVYASGTKGARLGRLATVITYTLPAPTVTTDAASSIATTSVTLNGTGNPNGATTTGWFRYSTSSPGTCNDTFGTRAPASGGTALGSGTTGVAYSRSVSGLTVNTTYYYCAIASNPTGTSTGSVQSFTTQNYPVPTLASAFASSITQTGATLQSLGNPNGTSATGWFRYSTSSPGTCNDAFGTRAPVSGGDALGAGNSNVSFNEPITGLSTNTTYYFCAIASNAGGTGVGTVVSFTTLPPTPTAPTGAAVVNVSGTENTVTWTDTSSVETGFYVERSLNDGSYTQIGSTSAIVTTYSDTTASADNTYTYRVRAFNVSGNSSYSTTDYVITATAAPNAPTSFAYFVGTSTPADVWTYWSHTGDNEEGFKVERSTDNVNFTVVGTVSRNDTFFSDIGPATGTYYYRVFAYNGVGDSLPSNTETVVVP